LKEDQVASNNERKRQGMTQAAATEPKAPAGKESAKRKSDNRRKPKQERQSQFVSASQGK